MGPEGGQKGVEKGIQKGIQKGILKGPNGVPCFAPTLVAGLVCSQCKMTGLSFSSKKFVTRRIRAETFFCSLRSLPYSLNVPQYIQ